MSWRQTKEGIIIAISQEKPIHDLHVRNTFQSFLRSTAGTTTLFWLGVTSQTWSVLLPIHQKLNRQVWRGEDRKQMYLCSCTAMTDKDRFYKLRPLTLQTEVSKILNCMVWECSFCWGPGGLIPMEGRGQAHSSSDTRAYISRKDFSKLFFKAGLNTSPCCITAALCRSAWAPPFP